MKYEWKKQEKELYGAKQIPALITVPIQNFIMISGEGNPNNEDFSDRVAALYSLAYAIKMSYKASAANTALDKEVSDFTVYPLEGVWRQKQSGELVKEELEYTIMIRFDDEPASFKKLTRFAEKNGLKRDESCHREIYLNNANRVEKSRLKTILRYRVH